MITLYGSEAIRTVSERLELKERNPPKPNKRQIKGLQSLVIGKTSSSSDVSQISAIRDWFLSGSFESRQMAVRMQENVQSTLIHQLFLRKIFEGDFELSLCKSPVLESESNLLEHLFSFSPCPEAPSTAEKEFESFIRLIDTADYLDTLTVDDHLINNPLKLLNYFQDISKGQAFQSPCKEVKENKKYIAEFPSWIPQRFSFAQLVCAILEQAVWLAFWQRPEPLPNKLLSFWTKVRHDMKLSIVGTMESLQKEHKTLKQELQTYSRYGINIPGLENGESSLKHSDLFDFSKTAMYYQSSNSLSLIYVNLERMDPSEYLSFISSSSLDRALTLFDIMARSVLARVFQQAEKDALDALWDLESPLPLKPTRKKKKKRSRKSSNSSSMSTNSTSSLTQIEDEVTVMVNAMVSNIFTKMYQDLREKPTKKSSKTITKKEKAKPQPLMSALRQKTPDNYDFEALHTQVLDFCTRIHSVIEGKKEFIYVLIAQLNTVVEGIYPGSQLELYGSYATGLALPSSDIDLLVDCYYIQDPVQIACFNLHKSFESYPWVLKSQSIPTASVPVVKLEVNLAVFSGFRLNEILNVDITFKDSTHTGLRTAVLSESLLTLYPPLKNIVLVLKNLLNSHGLSDPYTGGVSGYSLIIWVVAFINSAKVNSENYGELLVKILEFYGKRFEIHKLGINILNGGSFFEDFAMGLTTVDPTQLTNNTTRSSYNIQKVFDTFAWAHSLLLKKKLSAIFTSKTS